MDKKTRIVLKVFGVLVGLPAWIYFYVLDWKAALLIMMLMWSNNILQMVNHDRSI